MEITKNMPIVNKEGSVCVEYTIPKEIENIIPEYFYSAMAGELCSIWKPKVFDKVIEYDELNPTNETEEYYDLHSSTSG